MLDLDAILTAADTIAGKHGKPSKPLRETPMFPAETLYPCGIPGDFTHRETRETGFGGGGGCACDLHLNFSTDDTPTPAPPASGINRAEPGKRVNAVSFVSQERESEYPCGFAGDFLGKHPCFPLFPVFPADKLEAMVERAAIMEYDGGLTRAAAEAAAGMVYLTCSIDPTPKRFSLSSTQAGLFGLAVALGCAPCA
ncbi:hypothetical protein [Thiobacillus denitrificans]|uniref:hypothetical protein n=1 Tax=Thiobacillus denitrificans TaxID=36861 RepID=UPI00036A4E5A|nr:hypothetical protein [Thiobacillus denitrificans]